MKILAIDTTSSPVSVALLNDGLLMGEFFLNVKSTHSCTLLPLIDTLLKTTSTDINDIDVFAADTGPGSFTGVRIGVSSVKGMSMPTNKPCAAVSTLEAMAYNLPFSNGTVCSLMDARCSQVYNAMFRLDGGKPQRLTPDRALSIDELKEELKSYSGTVYLVGDGAEMFWNSYTDKPCNMVLTPENIRYQRAYGTAKAAENLAAENRLCSSLELQPFYLRLPQAERELKAKQKKSLSK